MQACSFAPLIIGQCWFNQGASAALIDEHPAADAHCVSSAASVKGQTLAGLMCPVVLYEQFFVCIGMLQERFCAVVCYDANFTVGITA